MCRTCPNDKPLFVGHQCVPCQNGTVWNVAVKMCVDCGGGMVSKNGVCECQYGRYFMNGSCVECFLPKYYNS